MNPWNGIAHANKCWCRIYIERFYNPDRLHSALGYDGGWELHQKDHPIVLSNLCLLMTSAALVVLDEWNR